MESKLMIVLQQPESSQELSSAPRRRTLWRERARYGERAAEQSCGQTADHYLPQL